MVVNLQNHKKQHKKNNKPSNADTRQNISRILRAKRGHTTYRPYKRSVDKPKRKNMVKTREPATNRLIQDMRFIL